MGHFQAADDARQQQAQAQGQGQEGARPAERASAGSGGGSGSGVPCADQNEYCPDWARAGECVNNPAYMIGDLAQPGACLKSCNRWAANGNRTGEGHKGLALRGRVVSGSQGGREGCSALNDHGARFATAGCRCDLVA